MGRLGGIGGRVETELFLVVRNWSDTLASVPLGMLLLWAQNWTLQVGLGSPRRPRNAKALITIIRSLITMRPLAIVASLFLRPPPRHVQWANLLWFSTFPW